MNARFARRALCLALVLAVALVDLIGFKAGPAVAGGCPEVRSAPPGSRGHVMDQFFDAFFCVVPLRYGTPDLPDRWGYRHILERCSDPAGKNHCWDVGARDRTATAIALPNLKCPLRQGVEDYYYNYMDGPRKRHQRVIVEWRDYKGMGPLGIRTSYWGSGHKTKCLPPG